MVANATSLRCRCNAMPVISTDLHATFAMIISHYFFQSNYAFFNARPRSRSQVSEATTFFKHIHNFGVFLSAFFNCLHWLLTEFKYIIQLQIITANLIKWKERKTPVFLNSHNVTVPRFNQLNRDFFQGIFWTVKRQKKLLSWIEFSNSIVSRKRSAQLK